MENINIGSFLNKIGLGFPASIEELDSFDEFHNGFKFESSKKLQPIEKPTNVYAIKPTKVDFHKRTVLAAEIIFQLQNERTLGHIKLQKIIFMCQNVNQMNLHTNFLRQPMGPFDPKLMRSIDSQLKANKWFEYIIVDNYPKYQKLQNAGKHRDWYEKYFKNDLQNIQDIINVFSRMKTKNVEIIVTVFACWMEILDRQENFTTELLIERFYGWSDFKLKYKESEVIDAIDWLKEKKLTPVI